MNKVFILLLFLYSNVSFSKDLKKGTEIAQLVDKANHGFKSEVSEMKMVLLDSAGNSAERELLGYVLDGNGDTDKTILEFMSPRDVKGTKLLTFSHRSKDDEQWLFLKSLRRTKRISSKSKQASFLNSDFSFEDLAGQTIEKYKHFWLKDSLVDNREVYIIEQVPNSNTSAYSKQISYIDKVYKNPVQIEYYGKQNTLIKVARFYDYKKISGFYRASSVEMKNIRQNSTSKFIWKNRKLGAKMDIKMFRPRSLKE